MSRIPEGPPIWVESLMSHEEYREYCKKYPTVCNPPMYKIGDLNKHDKWRYKMGSGFTADEIKMINKRIDELKERVIKEEV